MTWAWLTPLQVERLHDSFEYMLRMGLEEDRFPLTPEAKTALSKISARMGLRMVCHEVRLYLEQTKCRDLSVALTGIDGNQSMNKES